MGDLNARTANERGADIQFFIISLLYIYIIYSMMKRYTEIPKT